MPFESQVLREPRRVGSSNTSWTPEKRHFYQLRPARTVENVVIAANNDFTEGYPLATGMKLSEHCCEMMTTNLAGGETAILYVAKFREYGISVLDGGHSFIRINHCPWCGATLPGGLRNEWFAEIEARGLDPLYDKIPAKFTSDEWWKVCP